MIVINSHKMHYTELFSQLQSHGFKVGILDDESIVGKQPRIYLNGYGEGVKVYLFVDSSRRQNNFQNPISGYGLHVNVESGPEAKEKMSQRCHLKHKVYMDLHMKGFALKPVDWKVMSL